MASIGQLPSGRWQAQVRQRNGPPVSKSFLARADVVRWARIIEAERDRGLFLDRSEAERTTMADRIARYRDEVTVRKRAAVQERYGLRILRSKLCPQSVAGTEKRSNSHNALVRLRLPAASRVLRAW